MRFIQLYIYKPDIPIPFFLIANKMEIKHNYFKLELKHTIQISSHFLQFHHQF